MNIFNKGLVTFSKRFWLVLLNKHNSKMVKGGLVNSTFGDAVIYVFRGIFLIIGLQVMIQ